MMQSRSFCIVSETLWNRRDSHRQVHSFTSFLGRAEAADSEAQARWKLDSQDGTSGSRIMILLDVLRLPTLEFFS